MEFNLEQHAVSIRQKEKLLRQSRQWGESGLAVEGTSHVMYSVFSHNQWSCETCIYSCCENFTCICWPLIGILQTSRQAYMYIHVHIMYVHCTYICILIYMYLTYNIMCTN